MHVTASMLYNLVTCPHRVYMDLFADPAQRDEANPFVELLWEKGTLFEREVIDALQMPFVDLSGYSPDERERLTLEAMLAGQPLIYGGRIRADDLLGDPDLLRNEGPAAYIAGDIKSGAGREGPEDEGNPKTRYAVQLALYTDILERLARSAGRRAFVWDIRGDEVPYDFDAPYGVRKPRTLWQVYQDTLRQARDIVQRQEQTLPAYGAPCKFCHWYSVCMQRMRDTGDLTTIPELGRSKRDIMYRDFPTVTALAEADPEDFITGTKTRFAGIGAETLVRFHERAKLLTSDAMPYLRAPLAWPDLDRELFFDIEVDPTRDICYLHGFIERRGGDTATEEFVASFAEEPTPQAERAAFATALSYIRDRQPCAIYYYSKYERTIYRKLSEKYPDVCSPDDIAKLFDPGHAIDLYSDVVRKFTEWPTWDFSIKTLATFLGFAWRDTHPSGAASIEWFHRWVQTGDPAVRQRILAYNEDDCRATRVLRDALATLPVRAAGAG